MTKVLIAVKTCIRNRDKADAQRRTWVPLVKGADVRFFVGHGEAAGEEVQLNVGDDYGNLPLKVRAILRWALDNGYAHIHLVDDDVYIQPQRLLSSGFEHHDYVGRQRGPSGIDPATNRKWPAAYASGFSYWLSAKAAQAVLSTPYNGDMAEDRSLANALNDAGIGCHPDYRYVVVTSNKAATSGGEGPRTGNDVIAACEYSPVSMDRVHYEWLNVTSNSDGRMQPSGTVFDNICVLVKTLHRDGFLYRTTEAIERHMPGARMIIVDDGKDSKKKITHYAELRSRGHSCVWTSYDAGFGAKSNLGVKHLDRPYMLIFSDDFEANEAVADGVKKLISVLDHDPSVGVSSGRVDNNPYEGLIEKEADEDGNYIREHYLDTENCEYLDAGGVPYALVDLTVNYNLIRREVFTSGRVKWDEKHPIGGDHFPFYDQVKSDGWKIAWVPGVSVSQQRRFPGCEDKCYGSMRSRARLALPDFFSRYDITKFIAFDGRIDTLASVTAYAESWSKRDVPPSPGVSSENGSGRVRRYRVSGGVAKRSVRIGRKYLP